MRIFDEFKDKEDDAKYRKHLPVPRGLISFRELNIMAGVVFVFLGVVIGIFQTPMFWLFAMVIGYLLLMRVEFFVPEWLKKQHILYIISHMVIIPLVDVYASGLDWHLAEESPHIGLAFFFAVSYMNGVVLEFGRKIRAPEDEAEGVVTYTALYGPKRGVVYLSLIHI